MCNPSIVQVQAVQVIRVRTPGARRRRTGPERAGRYEGRSRMSAGGRWRLIAGRGDSLQSALSSTLGSLSLRPFSLKRDQWV
jgi:hypothetical protein